MLHEDAIVCGVNLSTAESVRQFIHAEATECVEDAAGTVKGRGPKVNLLVFTNVGVAYPLREEGFHGVLVATTFHRLHAGDIQELLSQTVVGHQL